MNRNLYNRDKYERKILPLSKEDDKISCLKLLTQSNKHLLLCHNLYSEEHINKIIEASDYIIFHHKKQNIEDIVGFALVKIIGKKKVLDILLLCAIPNAEQFGNMIAHSVFTFALVKHCTKIYTSPRTSALRKTFVKYGFEHLRGVEDIDEVMVKYVELQEFQKTNKTRKVRRNRSYINTININAENANNFSS